VVQTPQRLPVPALNASTKRWAPAAAYKVERSSVLLMTLALRVVTTTDKGQRDAPLSVMGRGAVHLG
jgi:hypothetical protein